MTLSYRHLAALSMLTLAACAAEGNADSSDNSAAAASSIKSYFSDAKKLDLGDLERVAVGFGADKLNDALTQSSGALHAGIQFEAPSVFAEKADPNLVLPDADEVKALDTIVSGLAQQFGETELGTQVNKVRLNHVQTTADKYFIESGFTTTAGIGPSWSFNSNGFANTGVTLGFNADARLTSKVIVASTNDKLKSILSAPLDAVQGMRGFVYPRSLDDVKAMKPGEMFALQGAGQLGANFGVGAPVFVAGGPVGYEIVVSAGVSGVISGEVDVQLVRLDGDEVVVDVGVTNGHGVAFHAGISDNFGIKGICDDGVKCLRDVQVAGKTVGLSGLVENAVENQVNKYLTFSIDASASKTDSRISLSRFRMHMDQGDKVENSKALEQLLKFDLRLAQAMYNRDLDKTTPAISADFDAVRAATTSQRSFGFNLLGMNIYHNAVTQKSGTFTIQTPDGAKSVLFDHLSKDGGWFESKHAFTRTGIAADSIDASAPNVIKSEANLFIETKNSDSHMDNDFAIDNVDGLLLGIAGKDVVAILDQYGNQLEQTMWAKCPLQDRNAGKDSGQHDYYWSEDCNVKLLDDPTFTGLKTQGLAAVDAKIAGLAPELKTLVHSAANIRLELQSVGIHDYDALNGCSVAWTSNARFDDNSLAILTSKSKDQYVAAMRAYLGSVNQDRHTAKTQADIAAAGTKAEHSSDGAVDNMANIFVADSQAYNAILSSEKALPTMLSGKKFIAHPLAIRFTVNNDDAKMMASAQLKSTSTDRALAATKLFDDLRDAADDLSTDLNDEQAAFYPLIQLVPAQNLEVGMSLDAKIDSNFFVSRKRFTKVGLASTALTSKGTNASTIDGGMFDLQTMIDAAP